MNKIENYVIVDIYTLQYTNEEGYLTDNISEAIRFTDYRDALEMLNSYDEPDAFQIYKVYIQYQFERCDRNEF